MASHGTEGSAHARRGPLAVATLGLQHCALKTVKTVPRRNWKQPVASHPGAETFNTGVEIASLFLNYRGTETRGWCHPGGAGSSHINEENQDNPP